MPAGTFTADGITFRANDIAGNQSVWTGGQTLFDDAGNMVAADRPLAVGGGYPVTFTATIANGASLSGSVDLGRAVLSAIIMPGAWTAAGLTFQVSPDNATFVDLYDGSTERTIAVAASRGISVTVSDWAAFRYLKVRSGTSGAPVTQGASRSLVLLGVL